MIKFAAGFATCWYLTKPDNFEMIMGWLKKQRDLLELKRDILLHDNPDLKKP